MDRAELGAIEWKGGVHRCVVTYRFKDIASVLMDGHRQLNVKKNPVPDCVSKHQSGWMCATSQTMSCSAQNLQAGLSTLELMQHVLHA
jgi:hypothetical protein